MAEYIEREAAIKRFTFATLDCLGMEPTIMAEDVVKALKAIPAADVVPVVRCGECKHCVEHYDTDGNVPYWVCKEWDSGTDYDGYCHYGEKKGR